MLTRRPILPAMIALLLVVAAVAGAAEKTWFDMDNCAMCKNISANPEMMVNMSWEQHNIKNGIVSIASVQPKYLDAYRTAHKGMMETGMRMHSGEKLDLCGSCEAFGACLEKGAQYEHIQTSNGDLMIVTADNAEVVAELQNWAKRNKEEMVKHHAEEESHGHGG